MSTFPYFEGIRSDCESMISEIGSSCTIETPTIVIDAFGNHTNTTYTTTTETIWIREIGQKMEIVGIGQLNSEDVRISAAYNTAITTESRITHNGIKYIVLGFDSPNESGYLTHKVCYGKKELT